MDLKIASKISKVIPCFPIFAVIKDDVWAKLIGDHLQLMPLQRAWEMFCMWYIATVCHLGNLLLGLRKNTNSMIICPLWLHWHIANASSFEKSHLIESLCFCWNQCCWASCCYLELALKWTCCLFTQLPESKKCEMGIEPICKMQKMTETL